MAWEGETLDTMLFYLEITGDYLRQMLPCAMAAALIFWALTPWRSRRLAAQGLRSGPWREGALLFLLLFCAGLAGLTLFPANFWSIWHWRAAFQGTEPLFPSVDHRLQLQTIQLIPFREISGALFGPWRFFMLLGNVVMFVPLGFFPALLWRRARWYRSVLTGLCTSTGVETIQFLIGRGSDVDDIILNTLGALAGYGLFLLLRRLAPRFTKKFRCIKAESLHG